MSQLIQALYSGVVLGAIYSIMAMGLALIWGGSRVLNLAHGALFLVGGYCSWLVSVQLGAPAAVGPIAAMLGTAVFGAVMFSAVLRPLMRRPNWENSTLVAGLGLAVAVTAGVVLLFGAREKRLPELVGGSFSLPGQVTATGQGLLMVVVGIATLTLISVFLSRTKWGVLIRALASNADGARVIGVNVELLLLLIFAIGAGLAGLAGSLYSSFFFLGPTIGTEALLIALIVTTIGGLGSYRGAIGAAYFVGILQSGVSTWMGTRWSLPVLFLVITVLLVVRPGGFASRSKEVAHGH